MQRVEDYGLRGMLASGHDLIASDNDLANGQQHERHGAELHIVAEGNGQLVLEGYASVFDSPYNLGNHREIVDRHAFDRALRRDPDVPLLYDHEGPALARTLDGSLTLTSDAYGLRVRATLDPDDPAVRSLREKMRDGAPLEMSFAFSEQTARDVWTANRTIRRLTELDLTDVSVVAAGAAANPATTAQLRGGSEPTRPPHRAKLTAADRVWLSKVELGEDPGPHPSDADRYPGAVGVASRAEAERRGPGAYRLPDGRLYCTGEAACRASLHWRMSR